MIKYIRTGSIACGSSTINREMVFESRLTKGAGLLQQTLLVGATTLKVKNRPCCSMRTREIYMGVRAGDRLQGSTAVFSRPRKHRRRPSFLTVPCCDWIPGHRMHCG